MIDYCGHINARTGRELQRLVKAPKAIKQYLPETHMHAKIAVILDFDTMYGVIHLTGVKSRGIYAEDFYAGSPCICENSFGAGRGGSLPA